MTKKKNYESPRTDIVVLENEGIIALSGEPEGNLGSLKIVEVDWQ